MSNELAKFFPKPETVYLAEFHCVACGSWIQVREDLTAEYEDVDPVKRTVTCHCCDTIQSIDHYKCKPHGFIDCAVCQIRSNSPNNDH